MPVSFSQLVASQSLWLSTLAEKWDATLLQLYNNNNNDNLKVYLPKVLTACQELGEDAESPKKFSPPRHFGPGVAR